MRASVLGAAMRGWLRQDPATAQAERGHRFRGPVALPSADGPPRHARDIDAAEAVIAAVSLLGVRMLAALRSSLRAPPSDRQTDHGWPCRRYGHHAFLTRAGSAASRRRPAPLGAASASAAERSRLAAILRACRLRSWVRSAAAALQLQAPLVAWLS